MFSKHSLTSSTPHDVMSLFTKTPTQETLTIIRERVEKDQDLKKRTNLEVDDIIDLT